jgi:hypothetical protein
MFVEDGPSIHYDNKVEYGRDNISIAELNGADEYGIEISYEVCKDRYGYNIEISADDDGDWEDINDYGGDSDDDNGDSSGDNGGGVIRDLWSRMINL